MASTLEKRIEDIEEEMMGLGNRIEEDLFDIIKTLISSSDSDDAVPKAVQSIRNLYHDKLLMQDEDGIGEKLREIPDHNFAFFHNTLVDYTLDLAEVIPFADERHDRLVGVVKGLKATAIPAGEFDPSNPQLGWNDDGLEEKAAETWRTFFPDRDATKEQEDRLSTGINRHAYLAKVIGAGLLDAHASEAVRNIREGLFPDADLQTHTLDARKARELIAALYVLHAGDRIKELGLADADKVAAWSSKLAEIGAAGDSSVWWHLSTYAQKAKAKLAEL
ncbi:hypothetical protein QBC44DRAFT_291983 [Cladorrhinum sp. PSN332]|nr:hypothetical protein QBC44DRAFT_291983 [Cladorrhinum sp. PSN332]